ncbi:hypothetical protein B0H10DRAFT_1945890 [Mycena sp. CBHHK59/15]|nr:hypothetical protein B0H10DRAFT_1945890 [Mycena sp. CBHHK59/15]
MIHSNKKRPTKIDHLQWRTNAPLTEAETLEVENSLAWALANVVTQNPADLSDERIQSYKVALAPHKKLPPEVLAIIFLYCVQPPIILPPSPHEPALILVSICSSWRNLLLHIPDLWSNIFLDFNRSGAKSMKLLEFSKLWLSRSETSLITIRNSTSRWSERFLSDGNVNPIRYLVTPYITRCREIDLRFLEASIDEFFTLPKGSIEHLEVLYLETGGFSMPFIQGSGETLDVFRSAPRLRRVLFSTDLCSFDPHVLGLPWGQLTGLHFIATYIPPMAMHAILRQSHSLIECSCSIIELNNDVSAALEQLHECVLPSLRSLMVEFAPETVNYAPFLRPLVLPSLKDLELRPLEAGRLPECTWSQRAYAGLLSRSAFTLRRLAILHYVVSPTDIEAIFRGMPSLVDLHLFLYEKVEWDKAILDMLAAGELLPKLQILTFSVGNTHTKRHGGRYCAAEEAEHVGRRSIFDHTRDHKGNKASRLQSETSICKYQLCWYPSSAFPSSGALSKAYNATIQDKTATPTLPQPKNYR